MSSRSVKDVLWEVLQVAPDERAALIRELCGDDAELAARVTALADAHDDTTQLLGTPVAQAGVVQALLDDPGAAAPTHTELRPGESLGPYTVVRRAGAGGFGTVYVADQSEPVKRRVALKVLHAGPATSQARARFEAERQVLARMEHPAIAHVFDAQVSEDERPYLVMEYIRGEAITQYCREHALPLREVLGLFQRVCQGLQHAHEKGVVHRDLKPSNILVTQVDGKPVPKVIDFGIAKATDHTLHDRTLSRDGQLIGTPAYMSPEQAAGVADVDTRSDIYALGVLLYELLCGALPFDQEGMALTALLRAIAQDDPPLPSRVLLERDGSAAAAALPPDLDWIVMRCLEKERTRRYPSAAALADDVGRFLDDLPVDAAPPSSWYRVRKLARRHRGLAIASAVVLFVLVAGVIGTGLGLLEARRANTKLSDALARASNEAERARAAEALAAEEARHALEQQAAAVAINAFLTEDILAAAVPSPESGRGRDVLLREVVDTAAASLDFAGASGARFDGQPRVESSIRLTLGSVYAALGEVERAVKHLRRALDLALEAAGPDHEASLRAKSLLGMQLTRQGQFEEADVLLSEALVGLRAVLGDTHRATLEAVRHMGVLRSEQGRLDEAYALLDAAWSQARDAHSAHSRVTLTLLGQLAIVAHQTLRFDEADRAFRDSLALRRARFGPSHPDTIVALVNLASFLRGRGEDDEALRLLEEAHGLQLDVLGAEHLATGTTLYSLGALQIERGQAQEAAVNLRASYDIHVRALGEAHAQTLQVLAALARSLEGRAPDDEIERLYRRAYDGSVEALGLEHASTDSRRKELASFLFRMPERRDEALALAQLSVEMQRARVGPDHPSTLASIVNLAIIMGTSGQREEARALYREAIEGFRAQFGRDHPQLLDAESRLAGSFLDDQRFSEALELTQHTVDAGERELDADAYELTNFRLRHGLALAGLDRWGEAREQFEIAHEVLQRTRGEADVMTAFAAGQLEEWAAEGH